VKWKTFVYEEANGSSPHVNGLNGLALAQNLSNIIIVRCSKPLLNKSVLGLVRLGKPSYEMGKGLFNK
jgi:hypothetical protein